MPLARWSTTAAEITERVAFHLHGGAPPTARVVLWEQQNRRVLLHLSSLRLARDGGSAPYRLASRGEATPAALATYGADRLGVPGAPLLGLVTHQALGDRPIPVALDVELESDHGRVVIVSGGGTVAGYPTGPLAELITSAVVVRL